jgi:hypothetical protein
MNLARQFLADWVGEFDWGLIERLKFKRPRPFFVQRATGGGVSDRGTSDE